MDTNAPLPSVGQTWLADLGSGTPLGHFTIEITFDSETRATYLVTGGTFKDNTETMDYTTTKLRDGLYAVRWTEPESGNMVTHIDDYQEGTCLASSVIGGQFVQFSGTWTRVR